MTATNRQGNSANFPLSSLSAGRVLVNVNCALTADQLADLAAEAKSLAKASDRHYAKLVTEVPAVISG